MSDLSPLATLALAFAVLIAVGCGSLWLWERLIAWWDRVNTIPERES